MQLPDPNTAPDAAQQDASPQGPPSVDENGQADIEPAVRAGAGAPDDAAAAAAGSLGGAVVVDPVVVERAAGEVVAAQFASVSMLQRAFGLSEVQAEQVMDALESRGVVGPAGPGLHRDVLVGLAPTSPGLSDSAIQDDPGTDAEDPYAEFWAEPSDELDEAGTWLPPDTEPAEDEPPTSAVTGDPEPPESHETATSHLGHEPVPQVPTAFGNPAAASPIARQPNTEPEAAETSSPRQHRHPDTDTDRASTVVAPAVSSNSLRPAHAVLTARSPRRHPRADRKLLSGLAAAIALFGIGGVAFTQISKYGESEDRAGRLTFPSQIPAAAAGVASSTSATPTSTPTTSSPTPTSSSKKHRRPQPAPAANPRPNSRPNPVARRRPTHQPPARPKTPKKTKKTKAPHKRCPIYVDGVLVGYEDC